MTSAVMLFSSKSAEGVREARALLEDWLRDGNKKPPEKGN
jgi:hypothetical protein